MFTEKGMKVVSECYFKEVGKRKSWAWAEEEMALMADRARRLEILLSVFPSEEFGELVMVNPWLKSLGYWRAVAREVCKEFDPKMRGDMKRLFEPRLLAHFTEL